MIGEDIQKYSYDYLLNYALENSRDDVDKREGSIFFDAVAPAAMELAEYYEQLWLTYQRTYALTATGEYLDYRCAERGITRRKATYAIRKGIFLTASGDPMDIPIGSRFSTVSETHLIIYKIIKPYLDLDENEVPGMYRLECEESGTIGNRYTGKILPIAYIQGLATAQMTSDVLYPAQNMENDEELRKRYFDSMQNFAFGGNIADYRKKILEIDGAGATQIYPVWQGGGTVLCSVVDTEQNPISAEFALEIQRTLDLENAENDTGEGLGLAPIGHKVTVTTPKAVTVNIEATLILQSDVTMSGVSGAITAALTNYLSEVREGWSVGSDVNQYLCNVYIARITAATLSVGGIANVTSVTINGISADLILTQTKYLQQIPVLGSVVLHG